MIWQTSTSEDRWKEKAKQRAKENNALRKRLKEVKESRDNFRAKYYSLTKAHQVIKDKYSDLTKSLKKSQH